MEEFATDAVTTAWRQIPKLIELAPVELRMVIRKDVFALLNPRHHLYKLVSEIVTTGDTREARYSFQPTDFLFRLIMTLRAKEYDFTALKHEYESFYAETILS
jgi:hypothetical protein